MRRTTAILAATATMAFTVTACGAPEQRQAGGGGGSTAAPAQQEQVKELNLYSAFNKGTPLGTLQEKVLAEFTKETGIKVNVSDAVGDNAMQAYEAQVAAGKEADVVIINPTESSRDWVKKGAVVDAQPYLEKWGLKDKLKDTALEGWSDHDGKLLGLPYNGFEWPVYWNMAILKKAGITKAPSTDTEMIEAANKLKPLGIPLFVTGGGDWTGNAVYTHIVNSYVPPETMKKVWREGGYCSTPEVKKGIEYFIKLRDAGIFPKDVEGYMMDQQNQLFFTGKAAAMSGGSWWFEDVPEAMRKDIELGGIPVPADAVYKKPMAARGSTSGGFWISKNGAKKEEAVRKLIEKFYSQDVAKKVVEDTSTIVMLKLDPAPQPKNPLLLQALNDLPQRVEYVPMVDFEMPAKVMTKDPGKKARPYSSSSTVDQICKAYDEAY